MEEYKFFTFLHSLRAAGDLNIRFNGLYEDVRSSQDREGHAVAQLVEALRYKPEGRWFDSRWCH